MRNKLIIIITFLFLLTFLFFLARKKTDKKIDKKKEIKNKNIALKVEKDTTQHYPPVKLEEPKEEEFKLEHIKLLQKSRNIKRRKIFRSKHKSKNINIFKLLKKKYKNINEIFNNKIKYKTENAKVLWVYDGDTIKTEKNRIRLMGIDTTEIAHNNYETNQPGSLEATAYTKKKLLGKSITLVYEPANKFDHYGRMVALIIYDKNKLFNVDIMKDGFAKPRYYWHNKLINGIKWKYYRKYFKY